jgi:CelD/BcsL family acetyltransferase involved in cellulose biosynthesis
LNFPTGALAFEIERRSGSAESRRVSAALDPCLSSGSHELAAFLQVSRLGAAWRRLEKQAALPMQGQNFIACAAEFLAPEGSIRIHHVSSFDRLVGLFALALESGPFGRLKIVAEAELGEPGDALIINPFAPAFLADSMLREGRVIDLDRLPLHSPLIAALADGARGKGWLSIRPAKPTPAIRLGPEWRDASSQFNSGRRSDFRRAARKAESFGKVQFELLSPSLDEFDPLFDEAIGVEARSWKSAVGTAIAVDRCKENFFRAYFRAACAQGHFRLAFMRIDGAVVAMQMALESQGRYWLFKIGFDEAFARCSPGTLLMLHTIGWAAKRGLRRYEFLGTVEPWITQTWTREQDEYVRLRFYPYNLRGAAALAADGLSWLRTKLGRAVRR